MTDATRSLGKYVKEARVSKGLTQNELAGQLNITTRHLIAIESNSRKPSYELLCRIARNLELSIDAVLFSDNQS